jgi:hypothetical protein
MLRSIPKKLSYLEATLRPFGVIGSSWGHAWVPFVVSKVWGGLAIALHCGSFHSALGIMPILGPNTLKNR